MDGLKSEIAKSLKKVRHTYLGLSPLASATVVFLAMVVLIGYSRTTAMDDLDRTRTNLIEQRTQLSETNISQQIKEYENNLLAGRGFFESQDTVDRAEWRNFVKSLNIEERQKGVIGLGYVDFLKPSEVAAYEGSFKREGFKNFKIKPENPKRNIYSSITLLEPLNDGNRRALGYDMYTEKARRLAMDQAIETGEPFMSTSIKLVQSIGKPIYGHNLYLAIYKDGALPASEDSRKSSVVGFVYSPFIAENLFRSIFETDDQSYNFRVYEGESLDSKNLLYVHNNRSEDFQWVNAKTTEVAGNKWTYEFGIKNDVIPESIRQRPNTVLFGGLLFAFIIAAVVYLLLQRRAKAIQEKEEKRVQTAKDSMLSLASHQLRTPATGVKQYVGLVLEGFAGNLKKEQREFLQKAYESNERQLRIINEFLYLAKADANRIVVTPQKFDVVSLTTQILSDMRSEINEHKHTVKTHFPKRAVYCYGDVHSVRMIIENLINNAIKYTPNNGKIEIKIENNPGNVLIRVMDNGIGIEKRYYPLLFKQFSRIPNDMTKHISGSGIGLYLAKILAELNNGTITFDSEENVGSTFTLCLDKKNVKNLTEANIKKQ